MTAIEPVIVGVAGKERDTYAVAWAAREASSRGAKLQIVHVASSGTIGQARAILASASKVARAAAPGVRVRTRVQPGYPEEVLPTLSSEASLVVVGTHGYGAVGRLLIGSVAADLVVRSRCPVAVIPSKEAFDSNRTVVGVDGAPLSHAALAVAVDFAVRQNSILEVVHASHDVLDAQQGMVLSDLTAPWKAKHPRLEIDEAVIAGRPAAVLAGLSETAGAVVVGTHGKHGFGGLQLGSVSLALLAHARCPVIVVPRADEQPPAE